MLPRLRQRPLKPNWWTISPLVTSLILWAAILFAGIWTGSTLNDKDERVAAISGSNEVVAGRR
jgi:hypothetical protein